MEPLLRIENVSKAFPGVQALDKVDLEVGRGEIRAIVGENGAGKSTLMKILAGIYTRDSGSIWFDGVALDLHSTREAQQRGVTIIHQELNLALNLGIHQCIFMGRLPSSRLGFINWRKLNEDTARLLAQVELSDKPGTRVGTLSVAKQQLVEIAKALSFNSRMLIMDEPTSALNQQESKTLFRLIGNLKQRGVTIIYISHRLEEVFQIADRITVMRDGKVVGTKSAVETTHEEIVRLMTGKTLNDFFSRAHSESDVRRGEVVLEVRGLSQKKILRGVSFRLHRGEVLGIAGLLGSGRTELVKAIFGADRKTAGEVILEGKPIQVHSPVDAVRLGIALLPEDRKREGLLLNMNLRSNISLVSLKQVATAGFISRRKQAEVAARMVRRLNLKATGTEMLVRNLSGGNQQKVVISKWLAAKPKVLLLDDPTRGIDVGAKSEIYGIIRELANQGIGVLFISSEMPEVLGVSDRVLVMRGGEIISELREGEIGEERVMLLATGKREEPAKEEGANG